MTPQDEADAQRLKDRHVMVFHNADGTPDLGLVHVIMPEQTVAFLARFAVDSGEWRAVPAMDCADIDYGRNTPNA